MALTYYSGDEVRVGDAIRYHDDAAHVEFVVSSTTGVPCWIGTCSDIQVAAQ
jgi:hypothetical protein